jgi:iron complex outermembrane receptor protein
MFRYSHALAARAAAVAACALALAGGPAAAQSPDSAGERSVTLTGTLVDPAGAPIPQVSVGVTELRRGTTTGEDGRYEIPTLPPGVYHVSFQRLGYAPSVLRITLSAATHVLDATLTESRIELPGTQVTASGTATTPLTSPQPTSVLEGEALRQARTSTLGGTLEQLPGLRSWSTGSGIGKPAIRGLRSDRVVIASNDMRLESQQWGDEHGPQVETADIERIEVIRGPASVLYGSDALGGVVNIIPKPLPVAFGRAPFAGGHVFGGYHSADRGAEAGLSLEGAARGFGFRGSLTARGSDDVQTPAGRLFNSGAEALTGSGSVGVRGSGGSLDLSYARRDERVEIHDDPAEDPGGTPYQKILDDQVRLSAIVPTGGSSRLEVNLGAGQNHRREFESDDDPDVAVGLRARTASAVAHFHHPQIAGFDGLLGASFQRNRFTRSGAESLIPASTGTDAAVFAFEQTVLGPWHLALGARYDHRTLDAEDDAALGVAAQTRNWDAVSGNVGVLYRLAAPVALVANFGRGFRAPSSFDLFSNGVHEGTAAFEKGNPALGVETSLNGDVALRVQHSHMNLEVGGFVNEIRDYIYTRPTGTFDTGSGLQIFETIQGDARLAGYEASVEIHPERRLHVSLSSDFVRGNNIESDTPLPWIPPVRVLYGLRYEPDAPDGIDRLFIGIRGESVARQTRLDPLDVAVGPYTLAHAQAGIAVPVGARSVAFDASVRNLFDRTYRDFMSRFKAYADAPGRSITVRLTAWF